MSLWWHHWVQNCMMQFHAHMDRHYFSKSQRQDYLRQHWLPQSSKSDSNNYFVAINLLFRLESDLLVQKRLDGTAWDCVWTIFYIIGKAEKKNTIQFTLCRCAYVLYLYHFPYPWILCSSICTYKNIYFFTLPTFLADTTDCGREFHILTVLAVNYLLRS